jgi:hypothetical protein
MKNGNRVIAAIVIIIIFTILTTCKLEKNQETININIDENKVINDVPDTMFGFNYWSWVPSWGYMVYGTEKLMAPLKLKLLRFGGINNDVDWPDPVDEQAIGDFIDYCLAIGAEPVLQLPVARYKTNEERITRAFRMIRTAMKKTTLKYVSIGNEPDIYSQQLAHNKNYNVAYLGGYGVDRYIEDFNAIAGAVKAKYPGIKIIGLDLSNNRIWIPKFIRECASNLDYISVHYYPLNASLTTYGNVKKYFREIEKFYGEILKVIEGNARGKSIPLIIGEMNLSWEGDPELSAQDASMGTFSAGLWMADMIGVSTAQEGIFSIMPWSIREGWTTGFIDANVHPKPVYYVYKMFSSMNLSKLILWDKIDDNIRIYGYKSRNGDILLYIVNWQKTGSQSINVEITGPGKNIDFAYVCQPWSLTCLKIGSDGKNKAYVYAEDDYSNGIRESAF